MNNSLDTRQPANFVAACLPAFATHVSLVMRRHPGYLTREGLNAFLRATVNKHLLSIGVVLGEVPFKNAKSINRKHLRKFVQELEEIRQKLSLEGCEVAVDSGGFDMVQKGRLPSRLFHDYIDFYHEFLAEHADLFQYAFHLDLAPGYSHNPFRDENDMGDMNYISYGKSEQLPQRVRDKMLYIHHFRTRAILDTWRRLLFEDRLADHFKHFSTGGLATSPEMTQLPCIAYVIPLVDILHYAKVERGLRQFRFHVLGDSDWKALLVHALLEKHIQAKHGVEVTFTCDSSNLFQTIAMGRYTFTFDGHVERVSLRSDELDRHHPGMGTGRNLFYDFVNRAVAPYGLRQLSQTSDPLYELGEMTTLGYTYAFLGQLAMFPLVEAHCRIAADRLYPVYQSGELQEFERLVTIELEGLHSGITTENIPAYASRVTQSFQLLEQLDLDHVAALVRRMPEEKRFTVDDYGILRLDRL